ncbi:MAG TPA: hypothetical protein VFT87_00830 [Candidatus Saccharimonadales bacterium]|nr:hypothetical protein [Candidatus Saccharimonadales bacterium]
MKFFTAAVITALVVSGCSFSHQGLLQDLDRTPKAANPIWAVSYEPSDEEVKEFISAHVLEVRGQWEGFAFGSLLDESFVVRYMIAGENLPDNCAEKEGFVTSDTLPYYCASTKTLHVSIPGMRELIAQNKHLEPLRLATGLYIGLAASLSPYYVEGVQRFANNRYGYTIKEPSRNNRQLFGHCIAGTLTLASGHTWEGKLLGYAHATYPTHLDDALRAGLGARPKLCFERYWR